MTSAAVRREYIRLDLRKIGSEACRRRRRRWRWGWRRWRWGWRIRNASDGIVERLDVAARKQAHGDK